jgi:hypothetical protein
MAVVPSGNPAGSQPQKQSAFGNFQGFGQNKIIQSNNNNAAEIEQSGPMRVLASPRFEPFKVFIEAFQDVANNQNLVVNCPSPKLDISIAI